MPNPRKPAPRTQRKREHDTTPRREGGETAATPTAERSVQKLEEASREASRNGLPAPQKQI